VPRALVGTGRASSVGTGKETVQLKPWSGVDGWGRGGQPAHSGMSEGLATVLGREETV